MTGYVWAEYYERWALVSRVEESSRAEITLDRRDNTWSAFDFRRRNELDTGPLCIGHNFATADEAKQAVEASIQNSKPPTQNTRPDQGATESTRKEIKSKSGASKP